MNEEQRESHNRDFTVRYLDDEGVMRFATYHGTTATDLDDIRREAPLDIPGFYQGLGIRITVA